ncbi:MAG TPA: endonuclease/exonuclease/phosphatase family protein [Acidimicrobiia bacterium]|nr:endonuclease/exonuclease/phosphatase family protein [Acidimicrobiia bacterium]
MGNSLRLMTANLLGVRADPSSLAEMIDGLQPDLVVTQELGPDSAAVLSDRFPHHRLRPRVDHGGNGMASLTPAEFGEVPLPWRPGLWGRVEIGGMRPIIAGVHLRNPIVMPWWRSARIRGEQLDALFAWAEGLQDRDASLVVAGDMNASPIWPVYRRLAERWDDLVAEAAARAGEKTDPTWAWRPGWPRLLRIDHVFGSGARAVGTRVEPVRGSDHAALIVDLEFG